MARRRSKRFRAHGLGFGFGPGGLDWKSAALGAVVAGVAVYLMKKPGSQMSGLGAFGVPPRMRAECERQLAFCLVKHPDGRGCKPC